MVPLPRKEKRTSTWSTPAASSSPAGLACLAACAKRVFIALEHVTREGAPRLLNRCALPITAPGVVKMVVTDLGLFEVTAEGFKLVENAPGWSPEDIQELTEAKLIIAGDLREIRLRQ